MIAATGARMRPAARAAALLALAALAGCAPALTRPPGAPSGPRPRVGYERRLDALDAIRPEVLRGRRIALDPGHGGLFRGSLGPRGTAEADVNLGVALHLRDLLVAAGAEVLLTRDRDRDFLSSADSTLRADLAERIRIANAFAPELFVSIHHNADARGAANVNETQTYWKLGDDGASYELGVDLHRALVRNVGVGANRLLPGNYAVLRQSDAPAVLTETSYLTNARVERRLRTDAAQRLEAEALAIGITAYLARAVPRIEAFAAVSAAGGPPDSASFADVAALEGAIAGAFDAIELEVNGERVEPRVAGERFAWRPPAGWPPGRHRARVRARLAAAGTSPARTIEFEVRRPVEDLRVERISPPLGPEGGLAALRIRVVDAEDFPVPDSIAIALAAGPDVTPAETLVVARDGIAWAYLRVAPHRRPPSVRAWLRGDQAGPDAERGGDAEPVPLTGDAPARRHGSPDRFGDGHGPRPWSGWLIGHPGDSALANAPGTREPEPRVRWLNRDGFAVLARDSAGAPIVPALAGYRRVAGAADPPRLAALFGGALHGRRIVLDPAGGGDDPAGLSASGTRGATVNLEVARALGAMLEAAGAEVLLTRAGDLAISDLERVRRAEAFRPERFLRIAHGAHGPRLGHYVTSAAGAAWAARLAALLPALGLPAAAPAEDASWVLQQTSCPALLAALARVDDPAEEARLVGPGARRAEAYALLVALAREFAPDAAWPVDSLEVRDREGAPVAAAPVALGGALVLETDARGRVRFVRGEAAPIEAVVEHPRVRARGVLLDSPSGSVLMGPGRP